MLQATKMSTVFRFSVIFFCCWMLSTTISSVINCPPNNIQQEINPKLRQLCYAIEQALAESSVQQDGYGARLVDERNTNLNTKRQDVDHVFLRFGRKFGI